MAEITDPELLKQLGVPSSGGGKEVTDAALLKQLNGEEEAPSGLMDTLKTLPAAAVRGFAGALSGVGKSQGPISGMTNEEMPSPQETTQALEKNVTGPLYQPQTPYGQHIGEPIGEAFGNPASWAGPGGLVAKTAGNVGASLGSEAAGEAMKGSPFEAPARFLGGLVGGHATTTAPSRIAAPITIAPERQAMVDALRNEGVTSLSAGQRSGNQGLKSAEAHLSERIGGGGGARRMEEEALGQYTRAALRRVGENADRATPEVVDRAFNRIGGDFDRLTANSHMNLDQGVQNDLLNTTLEYHNTVNPMMRSPLIENTMNDVAQWAGSQGGRLTGEQYQNLRSRLSRASRGASNDPQLSHALSDMTESLDDAMERSMGAGTADQFRQARRQYRNMLVIERAASAPGEKANLGWITPPQLQSATKAVMGRRAYARGQGDFAELARSGNAEMLPVPNSGTPIRQSMEHAIEHLGLAAMLGLGGDIAGGEPAMLGMGAAGAIAPSVAGRALMSRPAQSYLSNELPGQRYIAENRPGAAPAWLSMVNLLRHQN